MRPKPSLPPPSAGPLVTWRRALVVVAHPDDESFGLGAVLDRLVSDGAEVSVLCLTHGEASTLRGVEGELRELRAAELAEAARLLGVKTVHLRDEPDSGLAWRPPGRLRELVAGVLESERPDGLVVFDDDGVTGHPDHAAATAAAVAAAAEAGLPVLAWTLPRSVAETLNAEYGTTFTGRRDGEIDMVVAVPRGRQLAAVRAHPSQAVPGSVLWRRLELLGEAEHLRWLRR